MTKMLVEDHWVDIPRTLIRQSDDNIIVICDVIRRPGGLVSGRMHDRGYQKSTLVQEPDACCVHVQDN